MLKPFPVLILSGESEHRDKLASIISECGLRPVRCEAIAAARTLVARQEFSMILSEDVLPDGDFRQAIAKLADSAEKTPVIVISRQDDWDSCLSAFAAGAFDYVVFPPYRGELERAVFSALSESSRRRAAVARAAA